MKIDEFNKIRPALTKGRFVEIEYGVKRPFHRVGGAIDKITDCNEVYGKRRGNQIYITLNTGECITVAKIKFIFS